MLDGVGSDKILTPRLPRWKHPAMTASVALPYRYASRTSLSFGYTSWLSRDPLKDAERLQGMNLYTYVGNRVAISNDPMGLKSVDTGVKICHNIIGWRHTYLTIDGHPHGFYPDGERGYSGLIGLYPGKIYDTDYGGVCHPVKLDPCNYNIDKFKQCVSSKSNATGSEVPNYNIGTFQCQTWVYSTVNACIESSKK